MMPSNTVKFVYFPLAVVALGLYLRWPPEILVPALQGVFPRAFNGPIIAHDPKCEVSWTGSVDDGVELFQNVFYAEDTGGRNRFKPPVSLELPRGTVVDATSQGALCPQGKGDAAFPFTSPTTNTSENCLSLKIARPPGTKAGAKLPVMVYLHGGGDILGSGSDQLYRPNGLIKQSIANKQHVIFVGVNYRLGFFGFAASQALKKEKAMNNGLRDQRAAFEWLKKHVHAFGGDPHRITAVGQSVGAASISLHMVSYAGKKGVPFEKAIAMSGGSGQNFDINGKIVSDNTAKVAEKVGCLKGSADSAETLSCLRSKPLQDLEDASIALARSIHPPFGEYGFYPQLDGDYLPERPSVLYRKGSFVKGIPTIASWNANDGAWYAPPDLKGDEAVGASFASYAPGLKPETQSKLVSLYPPEKFKFLTDAYPQTTVDYYRAAQLQRDTWFACSSILFAWRQAQHGNPNVWLYELNATKFTPVMQAIGFPYWRVLHLSDVPFLLNNDVPGSVIPLDNGPENTKLSQQLSSSAITFAYEGDPTSKQPGGAALEDWSRAFLKAKGDFPDRITLELLGGVQGTGAVTVSKGGNAKASDREKAVQWEDLFERCQFIDSIADEIGV